MKPSSVLLSCLLMTLLWISAGLVVMAVWLHDPWMLGASGVFLVACAAVVLSAYTKRDER